MKLQERYFELRKILHPDSVRRVLHDEFPELNPSEFSQQMDRAYMAEADLILNGR